MKNASKTAVVAVVLFFISIWVVMAVGITAVWMTEELRVFGLVTLAAAIVAGLLVVYFEWRARLLDRIRDESHADRQAT